MENVLQEVNRKFISLPEAEVRRNNRVLESILRTFIEKMKTKDPLFNIMFERVFYGGSYYDGLRVGKPEEFDLDLLLTLPVYAKPVLTVSNIPGFVHLQLTDFDAFMKQPEATNYRNFEKLFDSKRYLTTDRTLTWMEGLVQKSLNEFPFRGGVYVLENEMGRFEVKFRKGGPALTLQISALGMKIDVDLVACFVFGGDKWPVNGFRSNPFPGPLPQFFIVPKKPNAPENQPIPRYWRLSFQEQERRLMDNKNRLKPTIKLLKKLRDNLQHTCIASYYIKTVLLHIIGPKDQAFWNRPLSEVFMIVLTEYRDFIRNGSIPYYWNRNNNLIGKVNAGTLQNISGRLSFIIQDIERNRDIPETVAKHLLTRDEFLAFVGGTAEDLTAGAPPTQKESSCVLF